MSLEMFPKMSFKMALSWHSQIVKPIIQVLLSFIMLLNRILKQQLITTSDLLPIPLGLKQESLTIRSIRRLL